MISEFVHKVTLLKTHSLYLLYISLYLIHYISSLPSTWITLLLAGTFQKGKKWEKPWTAGWVQRRQWHPTPVLLPGKPHGWRSLVGCSPWDQEESDTTERLHFHFSLSCIGEGNGNPLQCSCLENPRDGGAWWAAVYGVAQSRTQLKQLSSTSSSRVAGKSFVVVLYRGNLVQYNFICALCYFTFKRKPLWKPKELHGVLHKWLTFDYLFEFHMESHWQGGLFQGLTWFLFSFLILSHCILYQLLLHHYEVGMKCGIAVCKLLLLFLNYNY